MDSKRIMVTKYLTALCFQRPKAKQDLTSKALHFLLHKNLVNASAFQRQYERFLFESTLEGHGRQLLMKHFIDAMGKIIINSLMVLISFHLTYGVHRKLFKNYILLNQLHDYAVGILLLNVEPVRWGDEYT